MNEQPDQIVNYVWINERPFPSPNTEDEEKLCGVPLHYIDRALHNAKRYPHAEFNIWIDMRFVDSSTKFWLESYIYSSNTQNVKIRDLCDIEEYNTEFDFEESSDMDIWARVDYARLLVLKNQLEAMPWCQVFYSDFDANDVEILSKHIQKQLNIHGLVIATTECNHIENSFFGFNEYGLNHLKEIEAKTFWAFCNGDDGYDALKSFLLVENFIDDWMGHHEIATKKMPVSQCTEIKPKKFHRALGLC